MSVTIKDIAERANISYPSVSRALAGKPGVSEETRQRVFEIARELNYQPNALARGLVQNRTSTIGLLVPDIINPFFSEVAKGVDEAAHGGGFSVFLCNSGWDERREDEYIARLLSRQVDGVILFPSGEDGGFRIGGKIGDRCPLILLGSEHGGEGTVSVSIDDRLGGELAAGHLLSRGYRSVAFIGGEEGRSGVGDRLRGFRNVHREYGIEIREELIVRSSFDFEGGYRAFGELSAGGVRPDAVFAENDVIALGVLQAASSAGLKVPGDLAVVGFDDIPMASFPGIELTTVRQPKYEMGRMAVDELFRKIKGAGRRGKGGKVILEPELIVRKTT